MYKHIFKKAAIVGIVLLSIAYSCENKSCCKNGETATFKDISSLDGCTYIVQLKNGTKLEITNLSEFDVIPKDGKTISITYHDAKDAMSICMAGKLVEADCICEE